VLLAAIRLARVSVVLAAGLAAAPAFRALSSTARQALLRSWTRSLLAALGVRMRVAGAPAGMPALVVANHVSWLDVMVLASLEPAAFVCKSEIAAWPAIGWLLGRVDTTFIRRRSFRDVRRVMLRVHEHLLGAQSVAFFPEGTTSAGHDVLEFRTALFEPASRLGMPVLPVALAYSSDAAAYTGDISFLQSLISIARERSLEVHVAMLRPIHGSGLTRRRLAALSRERIAARLLGLHLGMRPYRRERRAFATSRERNEIFTPSS